MKTLRRIARAKGVDLDEIEGGNPHQVLFDDPRVTTVPRHNEINELTARSSIINAAENWEED